MNSYTVVTATDARHIHQLYLTFKTWARLKPSLIDQPLLLIVDRDDLETLTPENLCKLIPHPDMRIAYWPDEGVVHPEVVYDQKHKFGKAQRYKIMSGFVHVPARYVDTDYWLKLDSDAVAIGQNDWIDDTWFLMNPNIVAHRWGFTKPAKFLQLLDDWARYHLDYIPLNLPLDSPESERISHPRISSWCGFFNTEFTRKVSKLAEQSCGPGMLPVPSQDTYMWYMAYQDPASVVRVNMKQYGWDYKSTFKNVRLLVESLIGDSNVS